MSPRPTPSVRPVARPAVRRARRALVVAVAVAALGLPGLPGPAAAAGGAVAAASTACPAAGGAVVPPAAAPAGSPDVVLDGHGFGHGMGLSQYGARGAALLGCSSSTILTTYYPGLVPARRATRPTVLVDLLTGGGSTSRAELRADAGPVRWVSGGQEVVQPQGATWTVRRAASDRLEVLAGTGAGAVAPRGFAPVAGGPVRAEHGGQEVRLSTWTSSGATPLVRRSDADAARFAPQKAGLEVRAVLVDGGRGSAVDAYLRGLAEMPVTWPQAAQEAQVVAARTFLLGRYVSSEDAYVVRPTTADQVWAGAERRAEDTRNGGGLARAVAATSTTGAGTVLTTASGGLARDLFYASSHGGWSETNTYVWGSAPVAHLRQVDDSRWALASGDPNLAWTVGLSWAQVADAFGLATATDLRVAPRGRAARTEVVVVGTRAGKAVTLRVTGQKARDALRAVAPGVRSSGFVVRPPAPVAPPAAAPVAGATGGRPVALDADGDGRDEVGWFSGGTWTLRAADGSTRSFTFGRAGDLPVTGDWDGDGRDGVGVVRAGVWHLREQAGPGTADRSFAYGRAGQQPVTGVWAPGRPTGIGVVARGTWHLRDAVGPGNASRTWTFGAPGAQAVPGDWDGDGVDDPGALDGARWTFGSSARLTIPPLVLGRPGVRGVAGDWQGRGGDLPGVGRAGVVHVAARLDDGRSATPWQVLR